MGTGFGTRSVLDSSRLVEGTLTKEIIGAAIEVHRQLGPGLLESAYKICLCHELFERRIGLQRQVEIPVLYKGVRLDCGYKLDILVEDKVVLELKAVEAILPVHEAQVTHSLKTQQEESGLPDELPCVKNDRWN